MNLNLMNEFFMHYATCKPSWDPEWTVLKVSPTAGNMTHDFDRLYPLPGGQVEVDWGDGTTTDVHSLSHTYSTAGDYIVVIKNCVQVVSKMWQKKYLISEAIQCGNIINSCQSMLGYNKINKVHDTFKIPFGVENCDAMFNNNYPLKELPSDFALPLSVKIASGVLAVIDELDSLPETLILHEGISTCTGFLSNSSWKIKTLPEKFTVPDSCLNDRQMLFNMRLLSLPDGFHLGRNATNHSGFLQANPLLVADIAKIIPAIDAMNVDMSSAFNDDGRLYGRAPAEILWLDKTPGKWQDTSECFLNCTGLSNYNDIPKSWGGPHGEYN